MIKVATKNYSIRLLTFLLQIVLRIVAESRKNTLFSAFQEFESLDIVLILDQIRPDQTKSDQTQLDLRKKIYSFQIENRTLLGMASGVYC